MIECSHQAQMSLLARTKDLVASQILDIEYCLRQEAADENDRWVRRILFWRQPLTADDILLEPRTTHQQHLVLVHQQLCARMEMIAQAQVRVEQSPSGVLSDEVCCLYARALEPIPYDRGW